MIMNINYRLQKNGFVVSVDHKDYTVSYEENVFSELPERFKHYFAQNLTFAVTQYIPLQAKEGIAQYGFPLPASEPFFFKNLLYDLLSCEIADKTNTPLEYLQRFYNTDYQFSTDYADHTAGQLFPNDTDKKTVILPFTFGKESLLTYALFKEVGLNPILFYSQEPVQPYEEEQKIKNLEKLHQETGVLYHFTRNEPGMFRYGKALNLPYETEIGWGTQTTTLALMALPYAFHYKASAVVFGSEYLNNEFRDYYGWKAYLSADQTSEWTRQQNSMLRLLTGGVTGVYSSLEPLDEINIFYILHKRYPQLGKYQFSCTAENPPVGNGNWCHACYKCARMYLFAIACGIEPKSIGFSEDLLQKTGMFNHYFGTEYETGSSDELNFAFYVLSKKKVSSPYVTLFEQQKLPSLKPWDWYVDFFTSLQPEQNLIPVAKERLVSIFSSELTDFRAYLLSLT